MHDGFRACPEFWVSSQNFLHVVPSLRGRDSSHPRSLILSHASPQSAVSCGPDGGRHETRKMNARYFIDQTAQ